MKVAAEKLLTGDMFMVADRTRDVVIAVVVCITGVVRSNGEYSTNLSDYCTIVTVDGSKYTFYSLNQISVLNR